MKNLKIDLISPRIFLFFMYYFRTKHTKKRKWQVYRPAPLSRCHINLSPRESARKRSQVALVLNSKRSQKNILHFAELVDEVNTLFGRCHRRMHPEATVLQADDSHARIHRHIAAP